MNDEIKNWDIPAIVAAALADDPNINPDDLAASLAEIQAEQYHPVTITAITETRHKTGLSQNKTRLKNRLLQEQRAALGKDTQPYHYSNEALMENEALTGRREPIDRDSLPMEKLAMLDTIQAENAVMIAQGIPSATRKARLFAIAAPIREAA